MIYSMHSHYSSCYHDCIHDTVQNLTFCCMVYLKWALLSFQLFIDFQEVPHFSSPALMEKYALTEHLNYIYYLRRGQPSFAYANFVAAKLLGHSNTTKRLVDYLLLSAQ